MAINIGIITVSDRASAGVYEDLSGQAIIATLKDYLASDWESVYRLVPDEQEEIERAMRTLADEVACCLIAAGCDAGSYGEGLRKNDARLWRVDASGESAICADCDFVASDRGDSGQISYYQFAGKA